MNRNSLPAVIALNGPPHCGKTWVTRLLTQLIPDAVVFQVPDAIYAEMQREGVAPAGMLYQDFKLTPDARQKTITFSQDKRASDANYFTRRMTDSEAWQTARVAIVDNIGFDFEMKLFSDRSDPSLLLRLDAPYNELEPMKSRARRLRASWGNDSRMPVEHHTMLTAYDSLQMTLLLRWLAQPLTREEAGPYNGIKQLWNRYFAAPEQIAVGSDESGGVAWELGGLGETSQYQSVGERVGDYIQTG